MKPVNEKAMALYQEIVGALLASAAKTGTMAELSGVLAETWCVTCLPLGYDGFETMWRELPKMMRQIVIEAREQVAGHDADALIAKIRAAANAPSPGGLQ